MTADRAIAIFMMAVVALETACAVWCGLYTYPLAWAYCLTGAGVLMLVILYLWWLYFQSNEEESEQVEGGRVAAKMLLSIAFMSGIMANIANWPWLALVFALACVVNSIWLWIQLGFRQVTVLMVLLSLGFCGFVIATLCGWKPQPQANAARTKETSCTTKSHYSRSVG